MKEVKGKESADYAEAVGNLGFLYDELGRFAVAEPMYKEALELKRRILKGDHPDLAMSINNMAMFYNERGDLKQAEPLLKDALEMNRRIYNSDHPALATSINNMAIFYLGRGDYKLAEPMFIEALEMRRRIFKGDHMDLARSINNLAAFYRDRGDYTQAEPFYNEALAMFRRIYKGDHPDLAMSINNMAVLYRDKGDDNKAEPLCKEALEMYRRIFPGGHPDLAMSINNMAALCRARGDNNKAEALYKESLEDYKNMLNNYFPSLSENEKKLFWNKVSNNFEAFNSFAVKRYLENPAIISSVYNMQLYTKALLFNSTIKIKNRILNSNDTALIEKYKDLTDKKEQLVKLYMMNKETRRRKQINIDSLEYLANEIEKELSLKSEQFAQIHEKTNINWKTIKALLKPNEAAVEVVRFRYCDDNIFTNTIYYAFLIITQRTKNYPDFLLLENGKLLENEYYNDYRNNIRDSKEDKLSYIRYWEKLNKKLKGCKKIYFSADGIYNKLNPATFLMPNGKYLLDIQDIQQVNSTKDLFLKIKRTKKESAIYYNAILIGNPNFALSASQVLEATRKIKGITDDDDNFKHKITRGIGLNKLPGTEKEIKDIEKLLIEKKIEVKTYLGDMALKTVIKTANNPSILHIATHGLFLEDVKRESNNLLGFEEKKIIDNPLLRSGLFFTGADNYFNSDSAKPDGDENGLLTAYEAMNLDLDKTELVVLSACETGLGEVINGEGVYGLRRAFQQAGAKTIVMSLWAVSDEATQYLMSSFYKNWVSGISKREAFSKAQQDVKTKYKDPYYWGAFIMVGE